MAWTIVHKTALDVNGTTPLVVTNSPAASLNDILYAAVTSFTTDTITGPAGWSVVQTANAGAGEAKVQLWRKIAGGSEGTTYSWSTPGGTLTAIDFFALTGGDTVTPEDVTPSTNVQAANTSGTATGVTTVTAGCLIIAFHLESGAAGSITEDGSLTQQANLLATGFPLALASGTLTQGSAGATGNKVATWATAVIPASILLAVRPSGSVAVGMIADASITATKFVGPAVMRARFHRTTPWNGDLAPITNAEFGFRIVMPNPRVGPPVLRQRYRPSFIWQVPGVATNQTITVTGIGTTEAFGSDKVNMQVQGSFAIGSAETFGSDKVNMQVRPVALTSSEAFGTTSVVRKINVTGIATAEAFGADKVNMQVRPVALTSTEAFGTAKLNRNIYIVAVGSAEAFGTHSVSTPSGSGQTVSVTGIASATAFGTTKVNMQVRPVGIGSTGTGSGPSIIYLLESGRLAVRVSKGVYEEL